MVKVRRCRPIRFCINKTGPRDVRRIANPTTAKTRTSMGSAGRTHIESKRRFIPDSDQGLTFPLKRSGERRVVVSDLLAGVSSSGAFEVSREHRIRDEFMDELSGSAGPIRLAINESFVGNHAVSESRPIGGN
jgi:hypothetical protein